MPLIHVVGARPNFMKAAPVTRALQRLGVDQELVHTGQHYDQAMSDVFFDELELPEPDRYLGVGSGTHAQQTAALMKELESEFIAHQPTGLVVYGDVNSTLAAALVAAKLDIPIAHVEAGLRSFDRTMPEEINRVVTDAVSDIHLVTSPEAIDHLTAEGVSPDRIHFVGNPMIDTLDSVLPRLASVAAANNLGVTGQFALVTLHRPANVDDPLRLAAIVDALKATAALVPVVFPVHPRGREAFERAGLMNIENLTITEPLGYLDFTALMSQASVVITDSGGIQEETTVLGVPCLTVRPNTERPITITAGTNRLVEPDQIEQAAETVLNRSADRADTRPELWDGHAADRIAGILKEWITPPS